MENAYPEALDTCASSAFIGQHNETCDAIIKAEKQALKIENH